MFGLVGRSGARAFLHALLCAQTGAIAGACFCALLGAASGTAWGAEAAAPDAAPLDRFPGVGDAYVVAVDGAVRFARHADTPHQPASLAKVLTALVLLDTNWQPEAMVPISARAARIDGSRLGLRAGERAPARELLEAALVPSANDACMALAEQASGGDLPAFVARMNARAAALGMSHSHFAHPCGLDDPTQYTTPNDLLRLAQAAMRVPEFARIVALRQGDVRTDRGRRLRYQSSNALLGRYEGADGVKTGQTKLAGKCVIAHVRRHGTEAYVVLLGAPNRWWMAAMLFDEVFRGQER